MSDCKAAHAAPVRPIMMPVLAPSLSPLELAIRAATIIALAQINECTIRVIRKAPFLLWKVHLSLIRCCVKLTFQYEMEAFHSGLRAASG